MATSNFQTQKSFLVLLCISITFFILLPNKVNSIDSYYSFIFTKFEPDQQDLLLQGDAVVTSTGKLQLNKADTNSVGRALYSEPIHIWDSTTGDVAIFFTSFTFVIDARNQSKSGDGIAFFLAPVDTQPQSPGGLLGLFKDQNYNKSNHILAVEFDTFSNEWDPKGTHVGFNVNSIKSIKNSSCDLESGEKVYEVYLAIVYEPRTKVLNAHLTYPYLFKSYTMDTIVDVKDVLPEYVRVGFSSATGDGVQTHYLLNWRFGSRLSDDYNSDALESIPHLLNSKFHDSM